MRASFLRINGVRLRYLSAGSGPALILLHPIGFSADCFLRNFDALGECFTVIAPDLPGHGFSDAVAFGGMPPQQRTVDLVRGLAASLGIHRYSLLGSSYGAQVAALTYFDCPSDVDALILVGSGTVFHSCADQIKALEGTLANGSAAMADPTLEACRRRVAAICFDPSAVPDALLLVQLTAYALDDRLSAYQETLHGLLEAAKAGVCQVNHRLAEIQIPTLVITGRDDIRANWKSHVQGSRTIRGAQLEIFERCGHLPYIEHPTRFNQVVTSFMEAGRH